MTIMKIVIDEDVLESWLQHYFEKHPRAKKKPIDSPVHPSINKWFIMHNQKMNKLKQDWKDFVVWVVERQAPGVCVEKCSLVVTSYFKTQRRHDCDNYVPKFILDGLVESGLLVDDDDKHVEELSLRNRYDVSRPRTEILFKNINYKEAHNEQKS